MIRGRGVEPFIVGALIARWCRGGGTRITVAAQLETAVGQPGLLRPSFHRFHAEIGLAPGDLDRAGAVAAPLTHCSAGIVLPFEPFGLVRNGVEFHQHWLRARNIGEPSDLSAYSPSFAMARFTRGMSCKDAMQMPFETGLLVDPSRYAALLEARLLAYGGTVEVADTDSDADLIFDCSPGDSAVRWTGNRIAIGSPYSIPGVAFHVCLEGARRWLALSAKTDESEAEEREFNRLSRAEADRIADMEDLLFAADPASTTRPALARKIAVFNACGRIPNEDYEVFAQHEWLAALLARGFLPARHDRLADAMPEGDLLDWLAMLRRKLAPQGMAA